MRACNWDVLRTACASPLCSVPSSPLPVSDHLTLARQDFLFEFLGFNLTVEVLPPPGTPADVGSPLPDALNTSLSALLHSADARAVGGNVMLRAAGSPSPSTHAVTPAGVLKPSPSVYLSSVGSEDEHWMSAAFDGISPISDGISPTSATAPALGTTAASDQDCNPCEVSASRQGAGVRRQLHGEPGKAEEGKGKGEEGKDGMVEEEQPSFTIHVDVDVVVATQALGGDDGVASVPLSPSPHVVALPAPLLVSPTPPSPLCAALPLSPLPSPPPASPLPATDATQVAPPPLLLPAAATSPSTPTAQPVAACPSLPAVPPVCASFTPVLLRLPWCGDVASSSSPCGSEPVGLVLSPFSNTPPGHKAAETLTPAPLSCPMPLPPPSPTPLAARPAKGSEKEEGNASPAPPPRRRRWWKPSSASKCGPCIVS